jgi:glutamate---cysteine ligase / carboxylate-amine ligase
MDYALAERPKTQGRRMAGAFTFGIEEEYFLVDAETKSLVRKMPQAFLEAAKAAANGRISPEFLQPQIEVISSPHDNMADARAELRELRRTIAAVAGEHGLAILASGTHPTAAWRNARQTEKARYDNVMHDLQMIGQRDLLCGLHVHVELPDPDDRVDLMYRMLPYLPLFLALSTSSPFWQSRCTGLKGYRLAAYDELPRTGVPELFRTRAEFDAYVAALVRAGVIEDSSYIWWAIRPSLLNPTLELRAPDSCTLVEDSMAIAALYRTVAHHLYVNRWRNSDLDPVARAIIVENKWQAQRHGVHATFAAEHGAVTVAEMLERVICDTAPDAEVLGCSTEINRCRAIVSFGTSADAQLAVFSAHSRKGNRGAALRAVTDWIAAATLQ